MKLSDFYKEASETGLLAKLSKLTIDRYRMAVERFVEFCKEAPETSFITEDKVNDFESWLRTHYKFTALTASQHIHRIRRVASGRSEV